MMPRLRLFYIPCLTLLLFGTSSLVSGTNSTPLTPADASENASLPQPLSAEDPLVKALDAVPAPISAIPRQRLSPQQRKAASGHFSVEQELIWRGYYDPDAKRRSAAQLIRPPTAVPSKFSSYLRQVESSDDTHSIGPIGQLQDPRAIPALRAALARMTDSRSRYFTLRALYQCGDWNHVDSLLDLAQGKLHGGEAIRYLAVYHPEVGKAAALEALGMETTVKYRIPKVRYNEDALAALALVDPKSLAETVTKTFARWPGYEYAQIIGDHRVEEAKPLLRSALAKLSAESDPGKLKFIRAYHYALARLGDVSSYQWLLTRARLYLDVPPETISDTIHTSGRIANPALWEWKKRNKVDEGELPWLMSTLPRLETSEAASLWIDLNAQRGCAYDGFVDFLRYRRFPVGSDVSADSLLVKTLAEYFAKNHALESRRDLTPAKRALALFPQDPTASRLLQDNVPDSAERDALLNLAAEFGWKGLFPMEDL